MKQKTCRIGEKVTTEIWAIIATGLGIVGAMGFFFRILNTRIGDLRTDTERMELRLNDKIDDVDKRLNATIDDVRTDMVGVETRLNEKIDGVETRLNEKIDGVETRLNEKIDGVETHLNEKIDGVETHLNEKIDGVENRLTVRMDAHDHRFDIVDERLRAVERGNAEVIGAVNMMQTIVVETLNREIDSERGAAVTAD